jgi:hypothetical protein
VIGSSGPAELDQRQDRTSPGGPETICVIVVAFVKEAERSLV